MLKINEIICSFRLPIINDRFENYIFLDINKFNKPPEASFDNPVKHKKLIIVGDQGTGKTTLDRALAYKAIKLYGVQNVNAVRANNISDLLLYGLNKQLVQFNFVDDYTLATEDKDMIRAYFKIREIWKHIYKITNGLIISVYSLHRFHASLKEIRGTANVVIIKSDSISEYDHRIIKSYIGEEGESDLKLIEAYRDDYPELMDYGIVHTRTGETGLIKYPYTNENCLTNIDMAYKKSIPFADVCLKNSNIRGML